MVKTREYQALLSTCSQEGCLICNLVHESIRRYLDAWKYELFTDVDIRQELRNTQGFCHTHTWQLARMGPHYPLPRLTAIFSLIPLINCNRTPRKQARAASSAASSKTRTTPIINLTVLPANKKARPKSATSTACARPSLMMNFWQPSRNPQDSAWTTSS
nr:DUF6062 family protein [Dictyobacter kobayashii]